MASIHSGHRTYAMSRIPMRITNTTDTPERKEIQRTSSGIDQRAGKMKDQLSPLQKLQLEYQEKLQVEKENKMTSLYKKSSEEALKRVEKHGGKRSHKLVQDENAPGNHLPKKESTPTGYSNSNQKHLAISAQLRMRQRKPQKLPPLNNVSKARSFHTTENRKSPLATPPRKVRNGYPLLLHNVPEDPPSKLRNPVIQVEEGHSSPPPNIQHLRLLRERKQQQKVQMRLEKELRSRESPEDLGLSLKTRKNTSGFEKWQQGQDAERAARLHKHYAQQDEARNHQGYLTFSNQKPTNIVPPHDHKKHKAPNKTFVTNTTSTKMTPVVRRQLNGQTTRQETLHQGTENKKLIAELEREMKQKQMDLKRMQEREKRSRLDSISNAASGSENESDHKIRFTSSQSHTPILKPVKVPSKRFGQSNPSIFSAEDDDSTSSEIGFQMKPVLVRRDASRGSNRSTPQKDKTYLVQKSKVRHNPRNQTFMSPHLKIREEEEFEHPHPVTPPLLPPTGYNLDNLESAEDIVLDLVPCRICRRKFKTDRLAKHTKVCAKSTSKNRKVFDMTKARTQGTDAAKYMRKTKSLVPQKKKSNWRQNHEEFINNIRNAKLVKEHLAHGGKLSDLPPPPPSENPDYVKCQHCERKFDPAVAERHIPRCKDIKSRPKPPRRR